MLRRTSLYVPNFIWPKHLRGRTRFYPINATWDRWHRPQASSIMFQEQQQPLFVFRWSDSLILVWHSEHFDTRAAGRKWEQTDRNVGSNWPDRGALRCCAEICIPNVHTQTWLNPFPKSTLIKTIFSLKSGDDSSGVIIIVLEEWPVHYPSPSISFNRPSAEGLTESLYRNKGVMWRGDGAASDPLAGETERQHLIFTRSDCVHAGRVGTTGNWKVGGGHTHMK